MSKTPVIDNLKKEVDALKKLLDDPHPELTTWIDAYFAQVDKLMKFWSVSTTDMRRKGDAIEANSQ